MCWRLCFWTSPVSAGLAISFRGSLGCSHVRLECTIVAPLHIFSGLFSSGLPTRFSWSGKAVRIIDSDNRVYHFLPFIIWCHLRCCIWVQWGKTNSFLSAYIVYNYTSKTNHGSTRLPKSRYSGKRQVVHYVLVINKMPSSHSSSFVL